MNAISPISGYFELELPQGKEYHEKAIHLNSGRHCLEYILRLRRYRRVYVPFYTCESVLQPVLRLGLTYQHYQIDENLEPIFDFEGLDHDECFIYTDYFGLKHTYIQNLPKIPNIVIDNSQAFFSQPLPWFDTFYSPRKFFGVPDGGHLYTYDQTRLEGDLPQSSSYEHFSHLLKRIDLGPEEGYTDFKANDARISEENMMHMSKLTRRILSSIDYQKANSTRVKNFNLYHEHLGHLNCLPYEFFENIIYGPLVYPFLTDYKDLREELIAKKIYIAQYWPNVLADLDEDSIERRMTEYMVPLPIDQRYGSVDMMSVVRQVKKHLAK